MQAYVSVISDQNNVSIVADASTIPSLSRDLSSRGMALVSVKIEGRFHSRALDDALGIINGLCAKDRDLQLPPAEVRWCLSGQMWMAKSSPRARYMALLLGRS